MKLNLESSVQCFRLKGSVVLCEGAFMMFKVSQDCHKPACSQFAHNFGLSAEGVLQY